MPWGLIIYLFLTIAFTFFYANMQINPEQIAENFQKSGSYIPGIKPGNETERYIQQSLSELAEGRTTITIAHRLSTIRNCDRILVMDHGAIIEEGKYEELIARGGNFAQLVERQRLDV